MSFIDRLEELRNEKGITRKQLLKDCQLGKNQYTYWEKKNTVPTPSVLATLAAYFGVTSDYLIGTTDIRAVPDEKLQGIDFALSGEIKDLTENEKQDLLDYIRFKKQQKEER